MWYRDIGENALRILLGYWIVKNNGFWLFNNRLLKTEDSGK
jgi:hypothetical protein